MKSSSFYKDTFILTLSNLITGILGFMFSITLSCELGPEGVGLYGLIMPVYNLFICLISGGMVAAISRISAIYYAKNDIPNMYKSVKSASIFDFIWSLIVVTIFFANTKFFSTSIIKDTRTLKSLMIICPAMIFIAQSSILKGYFYGTSNVKGPALIDIFEKAVRITILVISSKLILNVNIEDKLFTAYLALTIGEFLSLFFLYLLYRKDKKNKIMRYSSCEDYIQLLFDILSISFPLCINGFLSTALSAASSLLMPRRLIAAGIEYGAALSVIGKFTGMALTIVFFPTIVINSISVILIPDLSKSLIKKDYWMLEKRISEVIQISLILGVSALIISIGIPDSLGKMFYKRNDLGKYIKFIALSAPLTYVSATTFSILNGLGRQKIILRNSLIISLQEIVLIYFFLGLPKINIYGYGISIIFTGITSLCLNMREIRKNVSIKFNMANLLTLAIWEILVYFILNVLNSIIPGTLFVLKNTVLILGVFALSLLSIPLLKKTNEI